MTEKEKAKAYDEAIERAKSKIKNDKDHVLYEDDVIEIFPELKEPDDEKIRKELIKGISKTRPNTPFLDTNITREEAIAWLEKQGEKETVTCPICGWEIEKQGEQKPAWSEKDEYVYNEILKRVADKKLYEHDLEYIYKWLKSLRPQSHWKPSGEQMKACKEVYADLLSAKGFDLGTVNSELNRLEEQLKKLK